MPRQVRNVFLGQGTAAENKREHVCIDDADSQALQMNLIGQADVVVSQHMFAHFEGEVAWPLGAEVMTDKEERQRKLPRGEARMPVCQ